MVGEMGDRNTPKPFEPPPWEKDQFEDLARKRVVKQDDMAIEQALQSLENTVAPEKAVVPAKHEERAQSPTGESVERGPKEKELPPQTEMLLSQLKQQEPRTNDSLWKIGLVFALIVGIIGLVLTVWGVTGIIAGRENGATAFVGGSIMIFFGLLFVSMAAWLSVRTMRQQGVL